MSKKAILACSGLFVAVLLMLGCGKAAPKMEAGRGAAAGTITFDGKPIRGGSIVFVSAKDPMCVVAVTINSDGTFSVADAPTGDVLVAVDTESQKFNNPQNYVEIPAKYKNVKTSNLKAKVGAGEPVTIELKSK